ncbi:MAG: hypothetical protein AAF230_04275 [Pseudomonadota bacterium]
MPLHPIPDEYGQLLSDSQASAVGLPGELSDIALLPQLAWPEVLGFAAGALKKTPQLCCQTLSDAHFRLGTSRVHRQ